MSKEIKAPFLSTTTKISDLTRMKLECIDIALFSRRYFLNNWQGNYKYEFLLNGEVCLFPFQILNINVSKDDIHV